MDIREALLAEHSRSQTMRVVSHVEGDPARFAELMRLFLGVDRLISQRAAWAVSYCVEFQPGLAGPYFGKFIGQLQRKDVHPAIRRNTVRLLQFTDIPKRFRARAFDACLALVDDPKEPVAVRAFAMTVAARVAEGHPEMIKELRLIVGKHIDNSTMAFCVRARAILD
ncbi:MAG: hypothetical protein K1X36_08665 [Pyrinomonadaceae bacterium]|nr:hypothetical protein [Pyrinomonadaceae bacterium]